MYCYLISVSIVAQGLMKQTNRALGYDCSVISNIYSDLCTVLYRVVQKKLHKVYGTIILQLYITESSGFQQNVVKEILYMT